MTVRLLKHLFDFKTVAFTGLIDFVNSVGENDRESSAARGGPRRGTTRWRPAQLLGETERTVSFGLQKEGTLVLWTGKTRSKYNNNSLKGSGHYW